MAKRAVEVETARGQCPEHGLVEGSREIPVVKAFGPVSYLVRVIRVRRGKRAPFLCPYCEREIELED
jgi:hypothetical protein